MSVGQHPLPIVHASLPDVYVVSSTGKRLRIGGSKAMALFRALERYIGQPDMAGEITIQVNAGGVAGVTGRETFK